MLTGISSESQFSLTEGTYKVNEKLSSVSVSNEFNFILYLLSILMVAIVTTLV